MSEIITKLTYAMNGAYRRGVQAPDTLVMIEYVRNGEWGIGEKPVTTDAVHAIAAGKE